MRRKFFPIFSQKYFNEIVMYDFSSSLFVKSTFETNGNRLKLLSQVNILTKRDKMYFK